MYVGLEPMLLRPSWHYIWEGMKLGTTFGTRDQQSPSDANLYVDVGQGCEMEECLRPWTTNQAN